ncbi:hypothetical protein KC19_VG114300 [Ceratodon purpureus]|uniref:Uncharacterized protein n=1 Tax=Ceratodon purpureus TaxID=3225 RepID=A0A8T0HPD4_CERPU|nr:hypothetical protein KC19_VG114300 [Ceratodon purpureus]
MHGERGRSPDWATEDGRRHVGFENQPGGWTWRNDLVAEPTGRSQPSGEGNRSCVVQAGGGRGLIHGERLTTWGLARTVESGDSDFVEAVLRMLRMWERLRTWIATLIHVAWRSGGRAVAQGIRCWVWRPGVCGTVAMVVLREVLLA